MPLVVANFNPAAAGGSKPGLGGAPAIHTYKTNDAITAVRVVGYFNAVRNLLQIGDLIYVVVVTNLGLANETLTTAGFLVVKDKPAGGAVGIDVTDQLALTVTDTD